MLLQQQRSALQFSQGWHKSDLPYSRLVQASPGLQQKYTIKNFRTKLFWCRLQHLLPRMDLIIVATPVQAYTGLFLMSPNSQIWNITNFSIFCSSQRCNQEFTKYLKILIYILFNSATTQIIRFFVVSYICSSVEKGQIPKKMKELKRTIKDYILIHMTINCSKWVNYMQQEPS